MQGDGSHNTSNDGMSATHQQALYGSFPVRITLECFLNVYYLAIAYIQLLIVGLVIFLHYQQVRRVQAWEPFALAKGFVFKKGSIFHNPTITGTQAGIKLVVTAHRRTKHQEAYCTCVAEVPGALPEGFTLGAQGSGFLGWSIAGDSISRQDITIGDKELDDAVTIKGHDEAGIQRLLRKPLGRKAALTVVHFSTDSYVEGGKVMLRLEGEPTDEATLRGMIDTSVEVAKDLAGA